MFIVTPIRSDQYGNAAFVNEFVIACIAQFSCWRRHVDIQNYNQMRRSIFRKRPLKTAVSDAH